MPVRMSLEYLLTVLVVGAVAGWLSGVITKGKGFGLVGNIIVGIIGALLGGFLFRVLGIYASSVLGQLIFALIGSLLFLSLLRFVKR